MLTTLARIEGGNAQRRFGSVKSLFSDAGTVFNCDFINNAACGGGRCKS